MHIYTYTRILVYTYTCICIHVYTYNLQQKHGILGFNSLLLLLQTHKVVVVLFPYVIFEVLIILEMISLYADACGRVAPTIENIT